VLVLLPAEVLGCVTESAWVRGAGGVSSPHERASVTERNTSTMAAPAAITGDPLKSSNQFRKSSIMAFLSLLLQTMHYWRC
jgi:hypothetical protein